VAALGVSTLGIRSSSGTTPVRRSDTPVAPNSAHRIIFWTGCQDLLAMSDADLARWQGNGVGGFSCNIHQLYGLGGNQKFTGNLGELGGVEYSLERRLFESRIAPRATALGMKMYLGFYLSNATNPSTPLAEWFDDATWSNTVLPEVNGLAAAAKALGFSGLAIDQELYPQDDGRRTATWSWDYPGNTRPEQAVREQVRQRGTQLMVNILEGFPNAELLVYGSGFPDTWEELVHREVNGKAHVFDKSVQIDLWNGLTAVDGFRAIRFINAVFYKTMHVGKSWDNAYTYEYNRLFALLSRRLSNWSTVADRIFESPFVWISAGATSFEAARPPAHVADQLQAARRWGMGRYFANYTYDTLRTFDYGPYVAGLRAAAKPGVVDSSRPTITVTKRARKSGRAIDLAGTATDNFAVRFVRWHTDRGVSGAARMNWVATGDPTQGWSWRMHWDASGVPLHSGSNRITLIVEDIKGLTSDTTITVPG
jgi:hypothetical protein